MKWLFTEINAENDASDPASHFRELASEISSYFSGALNPVHPKAQSKVHHLSLRYFRVYRDLQFYSFEFGRFPFPKDWI
jgi:hypothetical protein